MFFSILDSPSFSFCSIPSICRSRLSAKYIVQFENCLVLMMFLLFYFITNNIDYIKIYIVFYPCSITVHNLISTKNLRTPLENGKIQK